MQVRDNAFLVTGGGSGLGAACARHLVAAGANVLIVDVRGESGQQLANDLGPNARFKLADVTDSQQVQGALDTAVRTWDSLGGVINCAGILGAARVVGKEGPHTSRCSLASSRSIWSARSMSLGWLPLRWRSTCPTARASAES